MQASLHEYARTAELSGFANFLVASVEVANIAVLSGRFLERTIKCAESAVLRAEVRVIDVAVDDVGDHTFGMQAAAHGIGFHADADEVIGVEHLESLGLG